LRLEARQVTVEYKMRRSQERVLALGGVDLVVESGEFCAVLGPSGCGKTSLLNVIAGLQATASGQVLLDGLPVTGPGNNRAMVF